MRSSYSDKIMDAKFLEVNDHERTLVLLSLKSQKHLGEIWPLIKSQPLPREIVIVYTIYYHNNSIKELSTSKIY